MGSFSISLETPKFRIIKMSSAMRWRLEIESVESSNWKTKFVPVMAKERSVYKSAIDVDANVMITQKAKTVSIARRKQLLETEAPATIGVNQW